MPKNILAVSPDIAFLEQIRSHLEEGGRFHVSCVSTGREAIEISAANPFDVAILDAELNDVPFVPLTRDLVDIQPSLKLLVYPPQNNPHHPVLTGLVANGFLNKPFFTPEVGSSLTNLFQETPPETVQVVDKPDDLADLWLQKPEMGVHRIEQLLAATSATTGLLVMHGQVIAGSGPTDDQTVSNVINFIDRYWSKTQTSELVRYLRMEGDTNEHLIYAAPLIRNVALALIYPPTTPIIQVRNEVVRVKKEFMQSYPTTGDLRRDIQGSEAAMEFIQNEAPTPVPDEPFLSEILAEPENQFADEEELEPEELEQNLSEVEIQNINAILADMPSPDPEENLTEQEDAPVPVSELEPPTWVHELETQDQPVSPVAEETQIDQPVFKPEITEQQEKPLPLPELEVETNPQIVGTNPDLPDLPDFDFALPWEDASKGMPNAGETPPPLPPLPVLEKEETHSDLFTDAEPNNMEVTVQPDAPPGTSPLGLKGFRFEYSCLLIPGNPELFLTRDLAERLGFIMPQLHLTYGWRMTGISVRPQHMLWTISLPVSICPIQVVNEIRQRTSSHFNTNFPNLVQKNEEMDFWAPGFLILSGSQPPTGHLIRDFIARTRNSQQEDPV